jgi:NADH-quinone oxidoreductase subunit H
VDPVNDLFLVIRETIHNFITGFWPAWAADWVLAVLGLVFILLFAISAVLILVWWERRFFGFFQARLGPNRVGPFGVLQLVADTIKMMGKEDIIPAKADKLAFWLGPTTVAIAALAGYAVLPFGRNMSFADLNVGILYVVALSSLGVMGILMAGWGSNNKYALLGAMRGAAQMLSYEVPIVLTILSVVMLTGSLQMSAIVTGQVGWHWNILLQPLGFIVYFVASVAEVNRQPFDLTEADSEIVAGYHIEYSGIRFALFFLAEYLNAFAVSALITTLFLGGWQGPVLPPYIWFLAKTLVVFFMLIWVKATLPRLRVDQVMKFAWTWLIPLALLNLLATAVVMAVLP